MRQSIKYLISNTTVVQRDVAHCRYCSLRALMRPKTSQVMWDRGQRDLMICPRVAEDFSPLSFMHGDVRMYQGSLEGISWRVGTVYSSR